MTASKGPWPGRFVWHDLMTTDAKGSLAFYQRLFDWRVDAMPMQGFTYHMIHCGPGPIGGVIGSISVGWLSDRYYRREGTRGRMRLCLYASLAGIPAAAAFALQPTPLGATALFAVAYLLAILPVSFALLMLPFSGLGSALVFTILFGAANGLTTIVRGSVPLALFGPKGYGEVLGILATLYKAGSDHAFDVLEELRTTFGDRLFSTVIEEDDAAAQAPAAHQSVLAYRPQSEAAGAFRRLAEEVIRHGNP